MRTFRTPRPTSPRNIGIESAGHLQTDQAQPTSGPRRRSRRFRTLGPVLAISSLALPLAIACGGDSGGGSSTKADATDESFIAEICVAGRDFVASIDKVVMDPETFSSPEHTAKVLGKPFSKLATDFAAATPPSDLKPWAADSSKALRNIADRVAKGEDLEGITTTPFPDPPLARQAELRQIALKNQDCVDSGFTFEALAGATADADGLPTDDEGA